MNHIEDVDILDEAKDCFLTYSAEVLTDRAIPSAEDGLLSAQRKILWTMEDYLKMDSKSKTKKCQALVGSTLSTSYFHGDASCYGVLTKMAQEYLMRYPLLIGQGSLGTQESSDMVASARYTEAKPSIYADLMMNDFKKQVVPMKETYNGEFMEPAILPSLFPNALCNGRQGIGVSISHSSAPTNLTEVCDAAIAYIKGEINSTADVMKYIKGPDFPLPQKVLNAKDIYTAFDTGHSATSLKLQGLYEIKGQKIIFNTIPYRAYRNKIREQIEKNAEELEKYIEDFDDESTVGQNKLVFTLKKGASPQKALNKLFALTDLQTTFSYNMNFIVNGTPRLCSIKTLLKIYVEHQENVLIKATEYDKAKAVARAHILEGLIAAVDKIDEVIKIIKSSNSKADANNELKAFLSIDSLQADAILEMKLGKLTRIDKEELVTELAEKRKFIAHCNEILTEQSVRSAELIRKIENLKNTYGDERRTILADEEIPDGKEEEIKPPAEDCVVIVNEKNQVKRVAAKSYKTQSRNTVGTKNNEAIKFVCSTNTDNSLIIFASDAKAYRINVADLPDNSRGADLCAMLELDVGVIPLAYTSIGTEVKEKYIVFVTKNGLVKKSELSEYSSVAKRKGGTAAIKLKDGDSIASVSIMNEEEMFICTREGRGIRFKTSDINPQGRVTSGVKGINLNKNDYVISAFPVIGDKILTISETGEGKIIPIAEFSVQGRGGKGVKIECGNKLAGACMIASDDDVLVFGDRSFVRIPAKTIPETSRGNVGQKLIKNNSKVVSFSKV